MRIGIGTIPTEKLVASVTGERHCNAPTSKRRDKKCWNSRCIREGLVEYSCKRRYVLDQSCRLNQEALMFGTKVCRSSRRVIGLGVASFLKSDRECADLRSADVLHDASNQRRIDATGEKHSYGHIGDASASDARGDQGVHLIKRNVFVGDLWSIEGFCDGF